MCKRAKDGGVDTDRPIFGGEHLGPQAWKLDAPVLPLLSQYFDSKVLERADVLMEQGQCLSKSLIHAKIEMALAPYLDVIS